MNNIESKIENSLKKYVEALHEDDYLGCVKSLSVLEEFNYPDIEYYWGRAHILNCSYNEAIKSFQKIKTDSPIYRQALEGLVHAFMKLGRYKELDALFTDSVLEYSPMEEMELRAKCIAKMDAKDFIKDLDEFQKYKIKAVPSSIQTDNDAKAFFELCCVFTIGLVAAGECINQVLAYFENSRAKLESIDKVIEGKKCVLEYEKWCYILGLTKHVSSFRFPERIDSLASFALDRKTWIEKVKIFREPSLIFNIIRYIVTMLNPEIHKNINPYLAIESMLDAVQVINPSMISEIVNHYYEEIKANYLNGSSSAIQYIGYAYAEIIALEKDTFNLKDRIIEIWRDNDGYDLNETVRNIKLSRLMSHKAHAALLTADSLFEKIDKNTAGFTDYSVLALSFFRVIEIEYCEKLIIPLSSKIDIAEMNKFVLESKPENLKKWEKDCRNLEEIKTGKKESLPLGAIRTLLAHVINRKTRDESCAKYLQSLLNGILTEKGKEALSSREMLNTLDDSILNEFRVPGAHTGFRLYEVACESRKYVLDKLPEIVFWFTN